MKYIIITKKHINILKMLIILIAGISICFFISEILRPKVVQTFSPTDALKHQLPREKKTTVRKIFDRITGFSIDSPRSIIGEYSPIFENVKINENKEENKEVPKISIPEESEEPEILIEEKTVLDKKMIKNQTKFNVSLEEFENESLGIEGKAKVLIVHTHTTESYAPEEGSLSFISANSRSCEDEKNMIAVGKVIEEELKKAGIEVIHDKTYHDYPAYNGAYGRSLSTVKANMEKYNGINVVLDIHRDAVTSESGAPAKLVCDINGEKMAQIMFVVGTNGGGLEHLKWRDNLTFAAKIQKTANEKYPGLVRPVNLREERFNQHTTPCSIIIEVGTNANTLSEAKKGAGKIGECIGEVLTGI